jgi:hypothetical protein
MQRRLKDCSDCVIPDGIKTVQKPDGAEYAPQPYWWELYFCQDCPRTIVVEDENKSRIREQKFQALVIGLMIIGLGLVCCLFSLSRLGK